MTAVWVALIVCVGAQISDAADRSESAQDEATRQLLAAADAGRLEAAREALAEGARIDENAEAFSGPDQQPALVAAALRGHAALVELLLEAGADPSIPEKDGYTVWHAAAFQGRVNVLRVLAKRQVPGYGFHEDGFTPLHRASWGQKIVHTRSVAFLIDEGGRACTEKSRDGRTPLSLAGSERTRQLLEACLRRQESDSKPRRTAEERAGSPPEEAR